MGLDTANRSFAALFGASLLAGMFVFCGAVACALVGQLVAEIAREGIGSLGQGARWTAVVFVAFVGAGAAVGARSFIGQLRASRRLARRVGELRLPVEERTRRAAKQVGLRRGVVLIDCDESLSFVHGVLSPRVVVSSGLVERTTEDELGAVLEHERYHVRNLDPLKVLFARALPATFFYLPALRRFAQRYVAGRELAADRLAVRHHGQRPLAAALLKVAQGPQWPELRVAAAIGGPELLDVRITQLETGHEPPLDRFSPGELVATGLIAMLLVGLFAVSIATVGGLGQVSGGNGMGVPAVAGGVLCSVPWAIGAWLVYRWLQSRAT